MSDISSSGCGLWAVDEVHCLDGSREHFVRDAFGQVLEYHQRLNVPGKVIRHSNSTLDEGRVNGTHHTWNAPTGWQRLPMAVSW